MHLPDADPRSFRLVLSYIYTDKVQPSARGSDYFDDNDDDSGGGDCDDDDDDDSQPL